MTHATRTGNWTENATTRAAAEKIARRIEAARPELKCLIRDDMHWHTLFVDDPTSRSNIGAVTVYPTADGRAVAKCRSFYLGWAAPLMAV